MMPTVNDLFHFPAAPAGRMALDAVEFDPREVVEVVGDLLAGRALRKHLELVVAVAPEVPGRLVGDPRRLRQILLDLAGGAVKAAKGGEVALRAELGTAGVERAGRVELEFTVTDPGGDGDARGLTVSARWVELMGGRVEVERAPGGGGGMARRFTVSYERVEQPGGVEARGDVRRHRRLRGLRALVVDDNAAARGVLIRQLDFWGMIADGSADGPGAFTRLRRQAMAARPYDVAFIDLSLGSMDGYTLAWGIHNQPLLATTDLILMTPPGLGTDLQSCRHVGIQASVTKPFKAGEVWETLARVLGAGEPTGRVAEVAEVAPVVPRTPRRVLSRLGGSILVVDDDAMTRKLVVRQLASLGYGAVAFENGAAALTALLARRFDAVLLDLLMPGLDGWDLAAAIRARAGEGNGTVGRLPLIAMTACVSPGDRERCLEAGMDDYLGKPVNLEALRGTLERWVPVGSDGGGRGPIT